jgi:N utilization substance protein A
VPDDQLSLAIGREGQNARLAAKLTGWRIDIKSETEFAMEGDEEYAGADNIAKFLEASGYDERAMKGLLKEGRVSINGIVIRRYERLVGPEDIVTVDGDELERPRASAVATPAEQAEVAGEIAAEIDAEITAEDADEVVAEVAAEVEAEVEAELEGDTDVELQADEGDNA